MKINHDTGMAVGILAFCAFAYWQISQLPTGYGDGAIGPSFFPFVMATVITLLALALLGRGIVFSRNVVPVPRLAKSIFAHLLLFLLMLTAYALFYEKLGFFVGSAAVMLLGMLLLGERRPLFVVALPCLVIAVAWLGFAKLMKVALPAFSLF